MSFERSIVLTALFAIIVSLCGIYRNAHLANRISSEKYTLAGSIEDKKNDVKRKPYKSFVWSEVETGRNVYENDIIFVGTNSETSIKLSGIGKLNLGENTLLVLKNLNSLDHRTSEFTEIQLLRGHVAVLKSKSKDGPTASLKISFDKTKSVLIGSKAEFAISKVGDRVDLAQTGGNVQLQWGDKSMELSGEGVKLVKNLSLESVDAPEDHIEEIDNSEKVDIQNLVIDRSPSNDSGSVSASAENADLKLESQGDLSVVMGNIEGASSDSEYKDDVVELEQVELTPSTNITYNLRSSISDLNIPLPIGYIQGRRYLLQISDQFETHNPLLEFDVTQNIKNKDENFKLSPLYMIFTPNFMHTIYSQNKIFWRILTLESKDRRLASSIGSNQIAFNTSDYAELEYNPDMNYNKIDLDNKRLRLAWTSRNYLPNVYKIELYSSLHPSQKTCTYFIDKFDSNYIDQIRNKQGTSTSKINMEFAENVELHESEDCYFTSLIEKHKTIYVRLRILNFSGESVPIYFKNGKYFELKFAL